MSEDNEQKPPVVNYSSNSNKSKKVDKPDKVVKQITSGAVVERKRSLGTKFKETFAGDDAQTVGNYILFDVIIPATKNLISDMVREGVDRFLFGSSSRARSGHSSSLVGNRTSYNTMYKGSGKPVLPAREMSTRGRAVHDFGEIILESRGEAEEVIDALVELIDTYGAATVADLYACVGISANFPDTKYGWTSLSTASVRHIREGYLLDLPRAGVLE